MHHHLRGIVVTTVLREIEIKQNRYNLARLYLAFWNDTCNLPDANTQYGHKKYQACQDVLLLHIVLTISFNFYYVMRKSSLKYLMLSGLAGGCMAFTVVLVCLFFGRFIS